MAEKTRVEWTAYKDSDGTVIPGATYNPWLGCTKISPACQNCYAARDADDRRKTVRWGPESAGGTRTLTSPGNWAEPDKWARQAFKARQRRFVFCASWSDVAEEWDGVFNNYKGEAVLCDAGHRDVWQAFPFAAGPQDQADRSVLKVHEADGWVPVTVADVRRKLFQVIARTAPALDWLLLTKRPVVLWKYWEEFRKAYRGELTALLADRRRPADNRPIVGADYSGAARFFDATGMMPNVWVGATVESMAWTNRLPYLCNIPAVRRFVSAEPLVGPLTLRGDYTNGLGDKLFANWLAAPPSFEPSGRLTGGELEGVHWLITGGESGPGARPAHPNWYRALRDQAAAAGTPFHFKQHGEFAPADQVPEEVAAGRKSLATVDCGGSEQYRFGRWKTDRLLDGVAHDGRPPAVIV